MGSQVSWFEVSGKDGAKLQQFYGDENGGTQVTFYVSVDDLQAYLDKAEQLGGRTVVPVTEIPNMVTFAQIADPEGNVVGIVKNQSP